MDEKFSISELAKRAGYRPGMIRHFEKLGVMTPSTRTAAGYRLFEPHHVEELRFAREMQDLGFYAREIKALREIKLSNNSMGEKREAINKVFQDHAKYVEDKATYFANLKERLGVAAENFIDRVLTIDC